MPVGIIVGTGLTELRQETGWSDECIATPHGRVNVGVGQFGDIDVAIVTRHGKEGQLAPHEVRYQANIEALDMLGCQQVIATNSVGSLLHDLGPRSLALPDQFIDFTRGRPRTLFDQPGDDTVQVDLTEPYCPDLRRAIMVEAEEMELACREGLTYVCTEGPRFESAAEIRMFQAFGGHLVGMTGVPEVVFAREAGLCYASLCIVTNLAAGIGPSRLNSQEIHAVMESLRPRLRELLGAVVCAVDSQSSCTCCATGGE